MERRDVSPGVATQVQGRGHVLRPFFVPGKTRSPWHVIP